MRAIRIAVAVTGLALASASAFANKDSSAGRDASEGANAGATSTVPPAAEEPRARDHSLLHRKHKARAIDADKQASNPPPGEVVPSGRQANPVDKKENRRDDERAH